MDPEELLATVFVFGMFAGVFVIFLAMKQRSELLQMHHRERMAMIERGQIPTVESSAPRSALAQSRALSMGIIVIGLGLALMTVVSIAGGSPEAGVGVGGAIAIIGVAFVVRSQLVRPQIPPPSDSTRSLPPPIPPGSTPGDRI
jgi:hypothetical protein